MQQYFIDQPLQLNQTINLDPSIVFHLSKVLKMKPNAVIRLINQQGQGYFSRLNQTCTQALTIEPIDMQKDMFHEVTLIMALIKKERFEWTIQKATELGVHRIVLLETSRCVVRLTTKEVEKKLQRYHTIAKEAAEQSHRLTIPQILGPIKIKQLSDYRANINYLLYEKTNPNNKLYLPQSSSSVSVVIGPEGGFSEDEVEQIEKFGFKQASLTHRILRSETAAIMACVLCGGQDG
jgi:16S rRNA (uracil1498-N3)-methyltransferase